MHKLRALGLRSAKHAVHVYVETTSWSPLGCHCVTRMSWARIQRILTRSEREMKILQARHGQSARAQPGMQSIR